MAGVSTITNNNSALDWLRFRLAAWAGRLGTMKSLAEQIDDVGIYDSEDRPVLHLAVSNRQYGAVEWLLKAGFDPNKPDVHGVRALHRALWANDEGIIKMLLDHRADPEVTCPNGNTLLVAAAFKNNFNIVAMLLGLEHKMSHDTACEQNVVIENKIEEIATMVCFEDKIFRSPLKQRIDRCGATPLHLAAQYGHWHVMEALVRRGYTLDGRMAKDGRTALHVACAKGHYRCVEELLRLGASLNCENHEQLTPLMLTAQLGIQSIMSLLVRQDGELNRMNKYKETALHLACDRNNRECIRMLLEHGAGSKKVNRPDHVPPIHCLVLSDAPEIELIKILRIFVQVNADLDYECSTYGKGRTPIVLAFEKKNFKVACWLALVGCKIKDMPFDDAPEPYKQYLFMKKTEVPSLMASCRASIRQEFGHYLQKHIWSQDCEEFIERYTTYEDILNEESELPFSLQWSFLKII